MEQRGRNRILAKGLPVIHLERIDILRTNIRISDLGSIKIPVCDVGFHIIQLRTRSTTGIRKQQPMIVRECITQMNRREKLKAVLGPVGTRNRTPQNSMRMFTTYSGLRLQPFPGSRKNGINRIHSFLKIEGIINIIPPVETLRFRIPPFHFIIPIFQIRIILIAGFQLSDVLERQGIIQVRPQGFAVLSLISPVTLLPVSLQVIQVVEEIFQSITAIFIITGGRQLMTFLVKAMFYHEAA